MAQGSVFKRCTACSRRVDGARCPADGCAGSRFTWAYVVDVGRDAEGKRRQHKRAGFSSRKAAERALRDTLATADRGQYVAASQQTVSEFLVNEWLPTNRPPRVRPNTYRDRELIVQRHVGPRIGDVALHGNVNPIWPHRADYIWPHLGRVEGQRVVVVRSR